MDQEMDRFGWMKFNAVAPSYPCQLVLIILGEFMTAATVKTSPSLAYHWQGVFASRTVQCLLKDVSRSTTMVPGERFVMTVLITRMLLSPATCLDLDMWVE
jgi:hypothetical protein